MSESKVVLRGPSDLLLLGDAVRDVPLREVAKAALEGLRDQESDVGLYEHLFTNIIRLFEPNAFETEISCAILPKLVSFLEKIQGELQTNALAFFFLENLTILLRLAEVLLKLLDYISAQADQYQLFRSLVVFPEYLLRCYTIVRRNYVTMSQEAEVLESMKALFAACKKLLTGFLELLCPKEASTRRGYFRSIDHDEEYDSLAKVCILLASVGNEVSPIDSLLASDVWKVIVKICTERSEQCFAGSKTHWIRECVTILNAGIGSSFADIRAKNEPSKQCTIALKLNAFFLRVLQKLLTLSRQHASADDFAPIISNLLAIKTCLRTKGTCNDVATGIEQYLHVGYMAIVESSVRSEHFAKALSQYDCNESEEILSFYHVVRHVVAQTVSSANENVLPMLYCFRFNLLQRVCGLLKHSDTLFHHNGALYKDLLVSCAGLILVGARLKDRVAQKAIEETLVRMVLQEHYYTGLLGIDLWSVHVRYHSTPLMYEYFTFWKKTNDHYASFVTRPSQVYVAQLLRNLFTFLPTTHKEKIIDMYPASDSANDRLWATLGPLPREIDDARRKLFNERLEKRMLQGMKALHQTPPSVGAFYETLNLLMIARSTTEPLATTTERLWSSKLDWNVVLKTPSARSILECFARTTPEPSRDSIFISHNACGLAEASPFVKCGILKLVTTANPSHNVLAPLEVLLKDDVPFVVAHAFHVLGKLKDQQRPAAGQLFSKHPTLLSRLSSLRQNPSDKFPEPHPRGMVSVPHECHRLALGETCSSESVGDLTLVINNKIDELFPDDDDDDEADAIDVGIESRTMPKKRKFDTTSERDDRPEQVNRCLNELQAHVFRLEQLVQQSLRGPQRTQLQTILSTLRKVQDR